MITREEVATEGGGDVDEDVVTIIVATMVIVTMMNREVATMATVTMMNTEVATMATVTKMNKEVATKATVTMMNKEVATEATVIMMNKELAIVKTVTNMNREGATMITVTKMNREVGVVGEGSITLLKEFDQTNQKHENATLLNVCMLYSPLRSNHSMPCYYINFNYNLCT